MAAIALAGFIALVRRGRKLSATKGLGNTRAVLVLVAWLSVSLFAGSQCAWYLRPFCGVSTIPAKDTPFILGRLPDIRGNTSFYMAVYQLMDPPPLDEDYHRFRW